MLIQKPTATKMLVASALLCAYLVSEAKGWNLKLTEMNNIDGSMLFTILRQKIDALNEKLRWPEQSSWFRNDICNFPCNIFGCTFFQMSSSADQVCQQPGNRDHQCCQKYRRPAQSATERKSLDGVTSKDNDTANAGSRTEAFQQEKKMKVAPYK